MTKAAARQVSGACEAGPVPQRKQVHHRFLSSTQFLTRARPCAAKMSHGHDSHGAAPAVRLPATSDRGLRLSLTLLPSLLLCAQAKVAGEPTPFLSDPTAASTTRCKRRFNDLSLLRLDALAREHAARSR